MFRPQYGFTILEMIIVMAIFGILFAAAKGLFTAPSKKLIDVEACANTLQGDFNSYFFNSISGKDQYDKDFKLIDTSIIESYNLSLTNEHAGNQTIYTVRFDAITTTGNSISVKKMVWGPGTGTVQNAKGCSEPGYIVMLSGLKADTITTISLKNNVQGDSAILPMTISQQAITGGTITNIPSTVTIDLNACTKAPGGGGVERAECPAIRSLRFEIPTQSLKINTCLGIDKTTNECVSRSINNR